jgi:hypothetical protein
MHVRIHSARTPAPRVRPDPSSARTVVEGVVALLVLVALVGGLAALTTWGVLTVVVLAL